MLNFLFSVAVVFAVLFALYFLWRRRVEADIAEGAAHEWALYQKSEPEFLAGISEEKFREIYVRVHMPRFPGYALAALATFFVSLPATLAFLSFLSWAGSEIGIVPEPFELVRYVHLGDVADPVAGKCNQECQLELAESFSGFYYFFGVLAAWVLIVFIFTRRFHARRPGYLREEIIRARE